MRTFERLVVDRLTEIRDLLQLPPPEEARGCDHPEDQRVSLLAMGERGEHYHCGACHETIRRVPIGETAAT